MSTMFSSFYTNRFKRHIFGNSLVVQLLELCASTAGGPGLIPGWRTKISQALQCGQTKKTFFAKNYLKPLGTQESSNQEQKMRYIQQETKYLVSHAHWKIPRRDFYCFSTTTVLGFLPAVHFRSVKGFMFINPSSCAYFEF